MPVATISARTVATSWVPPEDDSVGGPATTRTVATAASVRDNVVQKVRMCHLGRRPGKDVADCDAAGSSQLSGSRHAGSPRTASQEPSSPLTAVPWNPSGRCATGGFPRRHGSPAYETV